MIPNYTPKVRPLSTFVKTLNPSNSARRSVMLINKESIYMLKHCGTMSIETDRLHLRQFMYSDDGDMLNNWISDPQIQSMISEPVYSTKEEVKELL